jgi:hypothetical protein
MLGRKTENPAGSLDALAYEQRVIVIRGCRSIRQQGRKIVGKNIG